MYPQYVADRSSSIAAIEAFQTQRPVVGAGEYHLRAGSAMLWAGGVHVALFSFKRPSGENAPGVKSKANRRSRCRMRLNRCWPCAPSPLSRPAQPRKKNMSLSNPSRSAKNQPTLVNTNKGQPLMQVARAEWSGLTRRDAGLGETPC